MYRNGGIDQESAQKDILISTLKKELYELKNL